MSAVEPHSIGHSEGGSILATLRRRAVIIVLTTLLVGGAAAAFAYLRPSRYQTTAELLFNQTIPTELNALGLNPATPNADKLAADNAAFVGSRRVAIRATQLLADGTGVDSVQKHVSVPAPKTSDVVDVVATASSAARVARLADAYSTAAIQLARSDQATRTRAIIDGLRAQLRGLKPSDPTVVAIHTRIAELGGLGSAGTGVPQLIQAGFVPTHKADSPLATVLLGVLFGLLLGLGLALLREQTDARLRHPRALSAAFEAPVLATVPHSRILARRTPFASLPGDVAAPFHMVLAQLRYGAGKPVRGVLITSAGVGQGKTTIAWNLAAAAAAARMSVILIDADLRSSEIASRYGLQDTPGLGEVLRGEARLADAIQRVPPTDNGSADGRLRKVAVLTAGAPTPEAATLLQSGEMTELLGTLRHHELLIIDASEIARQSDAISLLRRVDGVLIAAPLNTSRGTEALQLRSQLDALNTRIIGVIAVGRGKRPGGYVQAGRPGQAVSLEQFPELQRYAR